MPTIADLKQVHRATSAAETTRPPPTLVARPPSASLIVRSLSKPPVSPHNSWNASLRVQPLGSTDLQGISAS
jgi:hypothetical protein